MPAFEGLSPLSSSTSACVVPTIEEHETIYQYEPIVANEELRILLLEPGVFGEPLVGSLLVRKIGEKTLHDRDWDWVPKGDGNEWDFVSYCWGSQKDHTYFSCDGHFLRITTTVEDMLRHLREPFMLRYLWIDAICINQADNEEKSLQVLSMGKTYTIASNVVVWVGPATDQDRVGDLLPIFDDTDVEKHASRVPTRPIDSVSFAFPSLDAFFLRGWFKRRWILQEVVLSRELTIRCGRLEFTWQSLKHSADVHLDHEDSFHWSSGTQEAATQITMLDGQTNHQRSILKYPHLSNSESALIYSRILQLLLIFDAAQCADERELPSETSRSRIKAGRRGYQAGTLSIRCHIWGGCTRLVIRDQENSLTKSSIAHTKRWRYSPGFSTLDIGEMKGLCLSSSIHPICDTQTSQGCSTAMQFFMNRLSRWPVAGPSHDSSTSAAPVLSVAMYSARFLGIKSEAEVDKLSTILLPSGEESTRWTVLLGRQIDLIHRTVDTEMLKQLPGARIAPTDSDSTRLLQEANQLLDGQYAFCLDTSDELIFGLAFVRVEPGDLVFRRKTTSDPELVVEPVCALVIWPYRSSSSPCQDLFRFVGVCVDSYALMHGAGPKYEEHDIVLV